MWTHGHFYWNELMTRDPDTVRAFYEATVGWRFAEHNLTDGSLYWVAFAGDTPVAGVFAMSGPDFEGVPDNWMPYLAVDDVEARLEAAVAAGATVIRPAFTVPAVGRFAILRQPGGGAIGWMTPA
ncbi:27 kDa antigen Cfp30B [Blastochloris viridis]|uniref:27 kDa antigen Cfp30B n=2 Tax=Blastochloris viridis TaxID=1079 RepID=A0A0H5BE14_BLAVI|nr:27 kDa antigen Cfp30B [Blastochloris viridis]BAR99334.1 putative hydroxylase [Blastochloris viridis]CUU43364.1 27 kDa antigen Cfp30B [Blastochloris viridis]